MPTTGSFFPYKQRPRLLIRRLHHPARLHFPFLTSHSFPTQPNPPNPTLVVPVPPNPTHQQQTRRRRGKGGKIPVETTSPPWRAIPRRPRRRRPWSPLSSRSPLARPPRLPLSSSWSGFRSPPKPKLLLDFSSQSCPM